jgi:hypothetical protein
MFKKILIAIAAVLVVVLALAASKPESFRVERSISIHAKPDKIFPYVNDLHQWSAWSPWEKLDPDMKRSFSGAQKGKGAVYEWDGNAKIGAGRMEVLESQPGVRILIQLDFLKPFKAHNMAEFTLKPDGQETQLSWAMSGPNNYFAKLMQVFFSMDSMIGKEFEAGLSTLKADAEKGAAS